MMRFIKALILVLVHLKHVKDRNRHSLINICQRVLNAYLAKKVCSEGDKIPILFKKSSMILPARSPLEVEVKDCVDQGGSGASFDALFSSLLVKSKLTVLIISPAIDQSLILVDRGKECIIG